jgi:hypothetical protein
MVRKVLTCAVLALLPASHLLADFSYDQTAKITGGVMGGMMKVAGVFSKTAREPIRTTIAVKGDRMVTTTAQTAQVIDLSRETWTDIDFQRKQYSVMTFAEFRQMMEELAKSAKQEGPEVKFKLSVEETGQTRTINGLQTRQAIMKMVMEGKGEKGETAGMTITSDMWLAPKAPGYDEYVQFSQRMAQKLGWAPGSGNVGMMGGPDAAKAFQELYREGSKLDGVPVLQHVKMGIELPPGAQGEAGAQQAPPPQQQQQQQQAPAPSVGGVVGGAIGGRLGGLGGLSRGRKKEEPAPQPEPQPQQQQQQQQSQPQGGPGSLMEMVIEAGNFSSAPVDAAKFETPAGFRQVKPDRRMR